MFKAIYFLIIILSASILLSCSGDCASDKNEVVLKKEAMKGITQKPLLAVSLKQVLRDNLSPQEVNTLLGEPHLTLGSGLASYIWFFSDESALCVFDLKDSGIYKQYWGVVSDFSKSVPGKEKGKNQPVK